MFFRQGDKRKDIQVIALVELDMRKMRIRFVLAREAIRERLQELDHPRAWLSEINRASGLR
jgi:hypothetical protein